MPRKFTKKQQQYIDYVYKTLSSLGYDRNSIAGILGNALTESGLNADSVSESKSYHGGWQNHKTIRQAIEDQYKDYSLKSQLKYIHDWNTRADHIVNGKYAAYTAMNAGKYKTSGYKTAKDAADAFMRLYERPVIMKNGKIVGYQKAADRYANADEIYGYLNSTYGPPDGISVVNMPDGNKVMKISQRMYERPQYEPEFKLYHDPKTVYPLNPAAREVPESLDAWSGADSPSKGPRMPSLTKQLEDLQRDNPLNGGFKPEATIYGRRRLSPLSLKLPSLDQMLDLGSPQQQLTEYFADALQVPRMHLDVLPAAKDGKDALPKYEDGTSPEIVEKDGVEYAVHPSAIGAAELNVTTPELVITGRDRRPVLKRMYENPNLGTTDEYYDRDAVKSITEWAPGIGDVQQGFDAYNAAKSGNYTEAAMLGGLLLLPNIIETPLKAAGKTIKRAIDYRMPGGEKASDKIRKWIAQQELSGNYDWPDPIWGRSGVAEGKKYTKYPSTVIQNLENSIHPRMKTMRPWLTSEEFAKQFVGSADGKWTSHPVETFKSAYGDGTTVIGQYSPDTGNIAVRAGSDVESVLLHEIRHKLDDGLPLTEEEENILHAAYGDKFLEVPKVDPGWEETGLGRDYDIWEEAVTTNRDARDKALGKVKAREWSPDLQNKLIDKLSDQQILEAVSNANGYGRAFVDNLIGDGPLDASLVSKEQIKAWREAMKKVGMYSAAGYFGTRFLQPRQNK